MLAVMHRDLTIGTAVQRVELPFVCAKYRTAVRVVDFYPRRLEDFARARRKSEYDVLSDVSSGSSDEDDGSAGEPDSSLSSGGTRCWEWRFALRLEDANKDITGPRKSLWVAVNNQDAQLLTGLDACE
jgi:hypothetical protein